MAFSTLDIVLIVVGLIALACAAGFGFLLWKRSTTRNIIVESGPTEDKRPTLSRVVEKGIDISTENKRPTLSRVVQKGTDILPDYEPPDVVKYPFDDYKEVPREEGLHSYDVLRNQRNQQVEEKLENFMVAVRFYDNWEQRISDEDLDTLNDWYNKMWIDINPQEYRSTAPWQQTLIQHYLEKNKPIHENDRLLEDGLTLYDYIAAREG